MNVVGLGHACQVAHQLKRLGISKETHFFDWIVSTHDALMKTIDLRLDGVLFSDGIEFDSRKVRLRDIATGLWFYGHDFSGAAASTGIAHKDEVDAVREKYLRRSVRTRQALSRSEATIIRHFYDAPVERAAAEQLEITTKLEALHPNTKFSYIWISELPDSGHPPEKGQVFYVPKAADWRGDDDAWNILGRHIL